MGNNDIWILRFNSQGDTLWTRKYGKSYGDDAGYHLIIDQSDNIIAVGYTDNLTSPGVHDKQIWMHAVDLNGNNFWPNERSYGDDTRDEVANSIVEVSDGYILAGSINPKNSTRNIFLLNTNKYGIVRLFRGIESNDDDQGNMITGLSDGNFMVLGTRTNVSTNTSDILLTKMDASFNIIGSPKILDNGENESASCFIRRNNQIHILGTTTESRTDTRKILLIIADESGSNPEYHVYGLKNILMEGFGMDYTSDGGYVFTGSNLVLYKTEDSGEL